MSESSRSSGSSKSKCILCTLMTSKMRNLFPYPPIPPGLKGTYDNPFEDWRKDFKIVPMKDAKPGSYKIPYKSKMSGLENSIVKVLIPEKILLAKKAGLIGEIFLPIYIYEKGSDFLKERIPKIYEIFWILVDVRKQVKKVEKTIRYKTLMIWEEKARGELLSNLSDTLSWRDITSILKEGLHCLKDLHALHIYHRDMKNINMFYDPQSKKLTLLDFGFSCTKNCCDKKEKEYWETCRNFPSTPLYAHEGVIKQNSKDKNIYAKSDVYAFALNVAILLPVFGKLLKTSLKTIPNIHKLIFQRNIILARNFRSNESFDL